MKKIKERDAWNRKADGRRFLWRWKNESWFF